MNASSKVVRQVDGTAGNLQILKERLTDCVRQEGPNAIDRCEQVSIFADILPGIQQPLASRSSVD
jgi:hypothetical protein